MKKFSTFKPITTTSAHLDTIQFKSYIMFTTSFLIPKHRIDQNNPNVNIIDCVKQLSKNTTEYISSNTTPSFVPLFFILYSFFSPLQFQFKNFHHENLIKLKENKAENKTQINDEKSEQNEQLEADNNNSNRNFISQSDKLLECSQIYCTRCTFYTTPNAAQESNTQPYQNKNNHLNLHKQHKNDRHNHKKKDDWNNNPNKKDKPYRDNDPNSLNNNQNNNKLIIYTPLGMKTLDNPANATGFDTIESDVKNHMENSSNQLNGAENQPITTNPTTTMTDPLLLDNSDITSENNHESSQISTPPTTIQPTPKKTIISVHNTALPLFVQQTPVLLNTNLSIFKEFLKFGSVAQSSNQPSQLPLYCMCNSLPNNSDSMDIMDPVVGSINNPQQLNPAGFRDEFHQNQPLYLLIKLISPANDPKYIDCPLNLSLSVCLSSICNTFPHLSPLKSSSHTTNLISPTDNNNDNNGESQYGPVLPAGRLSTPTILDFPKFVIVTKTEREQLVQNGTISIVAGMTPFVDNSSECGGFNIKTDENDSVTDNDLDYTQNNTKSRPRQQKVINPYIITNDNEYCDEIQLENDVRLQSVRHGIFDPKRPTSTLIPSGEFENLSTETINNIIKNLSKNSTNSSTLQHSSSDDDSDGSGDSDYSDDSGDSDDDSDSDDDNENQNENGNNGIWDNNFMDLINKYRSH
jgi:hypothetical protein